MPFKVLQFFIFFIKEVLFERKEEADFKNPNFNPRKYIFLILLVSMLVSNYFLYVIKYEDEKELKLLKEDNKKVIELRENIEDILVLKADAEAKNAELKSYIVEKQILIEKLKDLCGKKCDNVY